MNTGDDNLIGQLQQLYESGAEFTIIASQDRSVQVRIGIGLDIPPVVDRRFATIPEALRWLVGVSLTGNHRDDPRKD